jgi:hypothetical protein
MKVPQAASLAGLFCFTCARAVVKNTNDCVKEARFRALGCAAQGGILGRDTFNYKDQHDNFALGNANPTRLSPFPRPLL